MEKQNSKLNVTIELNCYNCGTDHQVIVNIKDYEVRLHKTEPVQLCFPYLTREERESIISSRCPNCQKIFLSERYTEQQVEEARERYNRIMNIK